jgi:phosphoglycolate phosphatase-like HAD superfamily hydrolase
MTDCYVFDIDGTIADCSHRIHHIGNKDWRAFFAACGDDTPIAHIIGLARDLASSGKRIIYVSGRSDECSEQTARWLDEHDLPVGRKYMRKAGDHRPDNIVKAELLDQLIADGYRPIMAFDDRNQVVKMWRERGVPCAQVAAGEF